MSAPTDAAPAPVAPDWRHLPLAPPGRTLVEASAGTGKTWTIAVLYLRLLLEQGLSPRRIVVATYTQAAAEELRERLRSRIEQALTLATATMATARPDDPLADWLADRWSAQTECRQADALALLLALSELDLAPVGTLHSLCARILSEHPFAAGTPLDQPTLVDSSRQIAVLRDDLWRLIQADAASEPAQEEVFAAARPVRSSLSRATLGARLALLMAPGVEIAEPEPARCAAPWDQLQTAAVRTLLDRSEEVFIKNAALPGDLERLLAFVAGCGTPPLGKKQKDDIVLRAAERKGLRKSAKDTAEVLAVLDHVVAFMARLEAWHLALQQHFLCAARRWGRHQLDERLARAGQLGFDELLDTVRAALMPDAQGTRALADDLHSAWPVAMIDEFQDTDPTQYAILDAIYRDAQGLPRGRLLLIGDPKQAIYRFRGGDIHTYERAKAWVPEADRLRLTVNRRSSPGLVAAINAFYEAVGTRLGSGESTTTIHYAPVDAAPASAAQPQHAGQSQPPLRFFDATDATASDETHALLSCASRVVALLDPVGSWRLGDRPLQSSDLCVLVPNNAQATRLTAFLRERGVPVVNRGRTSVLATDTAADLLVLLDAVAHCDDGGRVRAALATRLWGLDYTGLRALAADAAHWQGLVTQFHRWQRDWQVQGVAAVVAAMVQHLAPSLLAAPDGERVLTDLRHLGELLQDAEAQTDGMVSLLAWFAAQRDGGDGGEDAADANALRLESDARCVQVMTLHASKGLEFEWVLLPLMGQHTGRELAQGVTSMPDGRRELVLDPAGLEQVALEEQDERHRVLYVALTRARAALEIWLPAAASVSKKSGAQSAVLRLHAARLREKDVQAQLTPKAAFVVAPHWPAITPARLAAAATPAGARHARALPPERVGPLPSRHSFTTLVSRLAGHALDPDASAQDEMATPWLSDHRTTPPARTRHAALDTLATVAGPDFGNALHAVLERRRIGHRLRDQSDLIASQLTEWGVRHPVLAPEDFVLAVAERLDAVLEADLDGAGLILAALPGSALRCEMEFHYVLDGARLSRLRAACAEAGDAGLVPAREGALAGLMNGKIDLLFRHDGRIHILDWKGNRLGRPEDTALEDYSPEALPLAMDAHDYRFQALLYTVALERHLRARLGTTYVRERHLGDVWYLFVRATGLQLPDGTRCGIWHHRFPDAVLDAAQRELSFAAALHTA